MDQATLNAPALPRHSGTRAEFPSLAADPDVVYLDSAATTQTPRRVIDAVAAHLADRTANPGRGGYPWATRASRLIAEVRSRTAAFIGAEHPEEVVFTAGATASLNAVAQGWGAAVLREGDEILYNPIDHSSLVLPWVALRQELAARGTRISLVPYDVTPTGEADTADIRRKLSPRTRLIVTSHVHGVFGARTTLRELRGHLDDSVHLLFDCSQSVGHVPVDVTELGADFATFSGHKMFALPGTGVLYCHRRVHGALAPFLPGGGTGVRLDRDAATGEPTVRRLAMPAAWENGTPNTPGIVALGEAIAFIEDHGLDRIGDQVTALTLRLIAGLRELPRVDLLPGVAFASCRVGYGIVSFTVRGERADDVGFALSALGFFVRTGQHCLSGDQFRDSVRVGLHLYTTPEDVDRFLGALQDILEGGG